MKHTKMRNRLRVDVAATAILACTTASAAAQTEPKPSPPPVATTDTADSFKVEEVIVTARRRNESIQTTPVAVTAISPSALEASAAPDIGDLKGAAPNLVIDTVVSGPSAAAISIRGVSFDDIEKSFDPAIGVLVDGVYMGTNTGQLVDFFDFSSVEILRGPQGTLFGRNTTAGVINIKRTAPTGEFGGKISTTIGDYGRFDRRAVLNLPEVGGMLSTKLFYVANEFEGYYHNDFRNVDEGGRDYQNFGATFRLTPTANSDLTVTLERQLENSDLVLAPLSNGTDLICQLGGPPFGSPANECNRNTGDDLYTTFTNKPGFATNEANALTAEGNIELGAYTLTSVTGLRLADENSVQDFDSSSIDFYNTERPQDYRQFSQELRVAGNVTDSVDVVAGLYYFNSSYGLDQTTHYGPFFQFIGLPLSAEQIVHHSSKSYAAFADVDWKFAQDWRLSVGGRYTRDKKEIDNDYGVFFPGIGSIPLFHVNPDESWSKFTPKVSVDYTVTPDALLYASYSNGFRSGGFNGRASTVSTALTSYDPETVTTWEAGAKTSWFDRRLTANLAVFTNDYKDKQEEVVRPAPAGSGAAQETVVANAASATISGVELEMNFVPMRHLTANFSLGLLDAKYDGFSTLLGTDTVPTDISSRKLRRAPDVTASFGLDYVYPTSFGDINASASYRYLDKYYVTIVGDPSNPLINDQRGLTDAQNLVNANLGLDWNLSGAQVVHLSVFGRNLLDDRGLNSTLPVAGLWTFGAPRAPRTYGVNIGYDF